MCLSKVIGLHQGNDPKYFKKHSGMVENKHLTVASNEYRANSHWVSGALWSYGLCFTPLIKAYPCEKMYSILLKIVIISEIKYFKRI